MINHYSKLIDVIKLYESGVALIELRQLVEVDLDSSAFTRCLSHLQATGRVKILDNKVRFVR